MFSLIRNELEKVFRKYSTYVLLGLMLLALIGMQWLMRPYRDNYTWTPSAADAAEEIAYYSAQGDETEARVWKFYEENLLDTGTSWDSWKMEALREAYEGGDEAEISQVESLVKTGNWQGYYQKKLDEVRNDEAYSEEEKEAWGFPYQYMLEHQLSPDSNPWQWDVALEYQAGRTSWLQLKELEQAGELSDTESLDAALAQAEIARYRLEHNLEHVVEKGRYGYQYPAGVWGAVNQAGSLVLVMSSVFLLIIAGGCVSQEFSTGTIKFLLINPVKRRKIFWSKFLAMLVLSVGMLTLGYLMNFGISLVMQGGLGMNAPYLYFENGTVGQTGAFFLCAGDYFSGCVSVFVMMTMSFMISSVLRSSAVAIGVSITCLMMGSMVTQFLSALGVDWGRFLIFANTDVFGILKGGALFAHQSAGFAAAVTAVYLAVFLLVAYDGFVRREV